MKQGKVLGFITSATLWITSYTLSIEHIRTKTFSRGEASTIIDTILFPTNQNKQRFKIARDAQFKPDPTNENAVDTRTNAMSADDPRLSFTYDEFPVEGMDQLLDLAVEEYKESHNGQQPNILVDLGSGCGRLVLYAAISKKNDKEEIRFQHVHGIEISEELHEIGVKSLGIGVEEGIFSNVDSIRTDDAGGDQKPTINLHLGPASELSDVLTQADIVFSYSTAFDTKGFDEKLGAMILSDEWSKLLAEHCKPNCVVVTTDKALDPLYGWQLKHRLDVENPKLFGTTGFVSRLH